MLPDYAELGGQEAWNVARLNAYLQNVGSPFTTGASICRCDTLTATNLGSVDENGDPLTAYDTPATDPAPWYDASVVESGDFLGFLPLSIAGVDGSTRTRAVSNAVGGGGVFGPARDLPRTITVNGLLIGASCCAADYGLHWLTEVLAGCDGDTCDGGCLEMFNCCPEAGLTKAQLDERHRRTFRRTAVVSGPTLIERVGSSEGCARGACATGGEILQVEFVLVAASPQPWTAPVEVLDVGFPIGGSGDCFEWCLVGLDPNACIEWDTSGSGDCTPFAVGPDGLCAEPPDDPVCEDGECVHADCETAADRCADPLNPVPTPPEPTAPESPFCIPLVSERACYTIDLSARPEWSSDVPMITVTAGATALRNVSITFYEKPNGTSQTCDEIADANRCNPHSEFFITYVAPGASVTIDGQVGRATGECGGDCTTASTVFGSEDGGPVRINEFTCAMYCVCLSSDPQFPPGADARVSVAFSGRGY